MNKKIIEWIEIYKKGLLTDTEFADKVTEEALQGEIERLKELLIIRNKQC